MIIVMRDKISLHQFVLFGALLILVLWKIISGNFSFNLNLLWWLLGSIVGFLFVFTDRFVYSFLMKPNEALGMRLKELFQGRKFSEALILLLNERHEQKELIMRSFLFVMVWLVLAFLTVTSIASPFGRGFMLGMGVHLSFDLIYDYFWNKERFELWFWQIKRVVSSEEKRWFVIVVSLVFVFLAFSF
ncbi:MAG: hypothetical protein UV68_C0056G0005 [Candidatus Collierbacteria bacterium GW2011_GWC2_43_12]|uniref:Uncharacterized protein n=1 Tax=Candidatus Collierbacteria bacterium GW2011_GWC2_43_12 TaxID=1618390 RepID=A0A0G1F9W2_9BACT|nr:MAG: hypothetical protein UV68_C0056G0005 [Candidatus Collierbacteria bacterium GW2011_GWC2_43_12]KKT83661.1 MAG: hypothetical protein UW80_C0009G0015 [Microgenomates group bacterium GW2011_GWC1_44_9]